MMCKEEKKNSSLGFVYGIRFKVCFVLIIIHLLLFFKSQGLGLGSQKGKIKFANTFYCKNSIKPKTSKIYKLQQAAANCYTKQVVMQNQQIEQA